MKKQFLIITEHKDYKSGQVLNNCLKTVNGILDENNDFIKSNKVICLTEKFSKKDEEEIKKIVRELLKKVFWRIYTRNSFLLQ